MYSLVLGTRSFSCHFLSSECKAGSRKGLGFGVEKWASTVEPSQCWAPIHCSSARNPIQQTFHLLPSSTHAVLGWHRGPRVEGDTALPKEWDKHMARPGFEIQSQGCEHREGRGGFWWECLGGSREELASELSIKNEEKWQRWGKENGRSKNREVEKSAWNLAWREGFSGPWSPQG